MRRRLAWLIVGAALGGCAGGLHSDSKPVQVYVLRAVTHPQDDLVRSHAVGSLHVGRPIAGPGLDSDHIVIVQADHRMNYYVASRWAANLPDVVEGLAVETLRASGAWSNVQNSASAFASEYVLQIVIRRFEADYSVDPGSPEVHVVLDCTVGRRADREILASFLAEGSATASANRLGDVVAAFETAANQALNQIAARSAQSVPAGGPVQNVDKPVPSSTR